MKHRPARPAIAALTLPVVLPVLPVLLAVALLAGCPDPSNPPPPGPVAPAGGNQGTGARGGIKVPLPPGWSARATAEEALAVGPPGKTILRIELWSGGGKQLPEASALAKQFQDTITNAKTSVVDQKTEGDHALAVLQISPRGASDAGETKSWLALLGAKRLGSDLFLCSSIPGATEDEVKAAAAACGAMSRTEAP